MKTPVKKEKRICKGFRRSAGHEGEPCKMPAVEGSDYCKYHGGGAVGKKTGKGRPKGSPKPKNSGGPPPKGNQNARKHGAYSARLLPDEQAVYEQIKAQFATELGADNLTASDQRLIHQLAVVSAKFDSAVENGAPPDALHTLNRMVLDLLRELKATRASKDSGALIGNTPADVMAALFLKVTGGQQPDPVDRAIPIEAKVVGALPADSDDPQDPEA
jgi:hypothetical protein